MPQHENTELGKYKIVGQIGEGAMGVVYRAIDPVLNRTVAIKVMSDGIARDDDLRGRFLREAQAAGSLQHPNVITIYDCGEVDGHLFIAMEFVEGQDLEQLLDKLVPLSLSAKLEIVIDVLGGLAYAHKRGIVHRDIKPANIRIDEEGRARIMDFGIAHLQSSSLTRTGVIVGTPAYMAPEQITGGAISPATDIFSVGAVLYELLAGGRPFHAETLQGVMYKIVSEPATDLSKLSSGLPLAMNSIVQRALAKDPADRFASALDMANALTEVRAGLDRTAIMKSVSLRSVIDNRLTQEHQAQGRSARRKGFAIGGSVAGAIVFIAAAVVIWQRGRAPTQPVSGAAQAPAAAPTSAAPPPTQGAVTPIPQPSDPVAPATATQQTARGSEPKTPAPRNGSAGAPSPKNAGASPTTPTAQELALYRSLKNTALDGRRRAAEAGATADQLQPGDDRANAADGLIAKGKVSDAADQLNQATTSWSNAERDARVAAAAASARGRAAASEPPKQPAAQVQVPVAPPIAAPAPAQSQPAPNPSAEIQAAVAAYARAIEARDIGEVRRAYPGITNNQATGFEQFFGSVRSLKVNYSVSGIEVNGTTAEAKLTGEYDYVTNGGKTDRNAVSFQASFRRDGGTWKLTSVR